MTCLVLFLMMEDAKPAHAADVWQEIGMLENRVKALEAICAWTSADVSILTGALIRYSGAFSPCPKLLKTEGKLKML